MSRTLIQGRTVTIARAKTFGLLLTFAALSATLISCGGSGGSESVEQTGSIISTSLGTSSTSPGSSSTSLNGGLTGSIVTTYDKLPFEFDLVTGESRFMPVRTIQDSQAATGEGRGVGEGYFSGTAGIGYIQSGTECFLVLGDIGNAIPPTNESCYAVFNENLERTAYIRTPNVEFGGVVKFSRSGRYLAYSLYYTSVNGLISLSETYIVDAVTHDNVAVHRTDEPSGFGASSAPTFDWGPNDELVFSGIKDGQIALSVANPRTFEIERTVYFPTSYDSRLASFELSPDGTRLLYRHDGSIRILDMSTLSITTAVTSELGFIGGAGWSPDGRWIMVVNRSITPLPVFDINFGATVVPSSNGMYVVPANLTQPAVVGGDDLGEAILVRYELEGRPGQLSNGFPGFLQDVFHFDWLP